MTMVGPDNGDQQLETEGVDGTTVPGRHLCIG